MENERNRLHGRNYRWENMWRIRKMNPHYPQAQDLSTCVPTVVPKIVTTCHWYYRTVLWSFMVLMRYWTVGSSVGSVRIRASIRWQACITVV